MQVSTLRFAYHPIGRCHLGCVDFEQRFVITLDGEIYLLEAAIYSSYQRKQIPP